MPLTGIMPRAMRGRVIGAIAAIEARTGITLWLGVLLMVVWVVRLSGMSPLKAV